METMITATSLTPIDTSNVQTFQGLYEKTGRAALSKTEHLVGRRDVAEEIVQETFLKLWAQQPQFPSEKAAYLWIYKTCHNAGIDYIRSAGYRREMAPPLEFFESLEGVCTLENRPMQRQLIAYLTRKLSAGELAVLAYRSIDGMTQDEVGEILELSRKTIIRMEARIELKLKELRV